MATIRRLNPFTHSDARLSQSSPCIHHCRDLTFVPQYLEYTRHGYSIVEYTQKDQDLSTRTVYHHPRPLIGSTRDLNMSEFDYASVYSRQHADTVKQRTEGISHVYDEKSWLKPQIWTMWDWFTFFYWLWVFRRGFTSIRDALEREYQVRLARQDGNTQAQGLYQKSDFYRELIAENFITWPLTVIQLVLLNITYLLHWLTTPVRWLFPALNNAWHGCLNYLGAMHQAWLDGQFRVLFLNWYNWIFSLNVMLMFIIGTSLLFSLIERANRISGGEHVVILQGDPSQRSYDGSSSHTETDAHGRVVPASSLICSQIDLLGRSTKCYWAADPTASIITSSGQPVAITRDGVWTEAVKSAVYDQAQHLKDAAASRASHVYDRANHAKDAAGSKAGDAYVRAHHVTDSAASKAGDVYTRAHHAKDAAASRASDVYDRVHHAKDAAARKAGDVYHRASQVKDDVTSEADVVYDRAGQAEHATSSGARVASEYVQDALKHGTDQAAESAAAMAKKVKQQSSWFNGWPFARRTPYSYTTVLEASRVYPSPELRRGYKPPSTTGPSLAPLVDATRRIKSVFKPPNVEITSNTQSRETYSGGPTPRPSSRSSESSDLLQSFAGYFSYWFTDQTTYDHTSDEAADPSPGAKSTIDQQFTTGSALETGSNYIASKRDYLFSCLPKWLGIEQTASQAREVESSIATKYQEDKQWTNQKLSEMEERLAEPWEKLDKAHSKASERMVSYEKEGYTYTPDPRLNLPSEMTPKSSFETSTSEEEIVISDGTTSSSSSSSSSSSGKKQAPLTLTQSHPDGSHFEYELELDESAQQALRDSASRSPNGEIHFELELTGSRVSIPSEHPSTPEKVTVEKVTVEEVTKREVNAERETTVKEVTKKEVFVEEVTMKTTSPPKKPVTEPGQHRTAEKEEEIMKYCRLCRQKHCCEWDDSEGHFVVR